MKNKFFRLGLPVILLAWGMMVAGCDNDLTHGEGGGAPRPKVIRITEFGKISGFAKVAISLDPTYNPNDVNNIVVPAATGKAEISNGSVKIALYDANNDPWTADGVYYIWLHLDSSTSWLYHKGNPSKIFKRMTDIKYSDFESRN